MPSGWLLAFQREGNSPLIHLAGTFYMDAIGEQGPHLQGNLQCSTKFTVLLVACTHTCTAIPMQGALFACISSLKCFTAHRRAVEYQQLSPSSKSLHMVFTFHNSTVRDVCSKFVCLCLSVSVNTVCLWRAD